MLATGSDLTPPVLLMAMPQVLDPFFHRSVVLLLHHENEGSFGFIVNRPTGIKVGEILKGMDVGWRGEQEAVAYFGGPVQPQLGSVLYTPAPSDEPGGETVTEVAPGVVMTQHIDDLSRLAGDPPDHFRLILGYAGWGEGQLLEEILRNDWLTAPVDGNLIFSPDPDQVWAGALRSVGIDPVSLPWLSSGPSEESAN